MRYIRSLERKDVGLDTSMIPLGSCTMKLNAATEMFPVSWPEFSRMHPFAPAEQAEGYRQICARARSRAVRDHRLCRRLAAAELRRAGRVRRPGRRFAPITSARGDGASRRRPDPGVGARHQSGQRGHGRLHGRGRRRATPNGNVDVADLQGEGGEQRDTLAALMITYPSTHGVFEDAIRDICDDRARARRPGLHGRRQHERAGRAHEPGGDRRRRVPPEPAQDVRHPARRRRSRAWARSAWPRTSRRTCRAIRWSKVGGEQAIPRGVGGAVGQRQHPAHLLRLHPHAGRATA